MSLLSVNFPRIMYNVDFPNKSFSCRKAEYDTDYFHAVFIDNEAAFNRKPKQDKCYM